MPSLRTRLLTLITGLALVAPLAACGGTASAPKNPTCPNGELTFGIEPYEAPSKLEPAYRTLADALSKRLNCPVKVQIVEDYAAEVLAMRNKKLDLGQFGPLGYVFASEKAQAEPIVSFGTADGRLSTYTAGLWVPKDSPIHTVADLRGHSLALGSNGSTSGDALPRLALREAGLADADVKANYAGGHPEALLALTKGTVDAAEINSQTLATAQKEGQFDPAQYRRIWESAPIPNDPVTMRADTDPALKDAVRRALTELEPAELQQVADFLDVTPAGHMVPVTKAEYEPVFTMARTLGLTEKNVS